MERLIAGRYEIISILGRGGMGTVYLAHDPVIRRRVAVKLMELPSMPAEDYAAWFANEARAAGTLQHPNIVSVYDYGEDQGHPFMVMEYVDGTSGL